MKPARRHKTISGPSVNQNSYVVVEFRLASGEAMPLVVHRESRRPETYALRYTLIAYRASGASPNTIRNVSKGLAVGLSFIEKRGIDLMQRLASGLFLTREELADFANRCLQRSDGLGAVVQIYAKRRYTDFLEYLLWRFEAVAHRASRADLPMLLADQSEFRKRIRAQQPKRRAGAAERDRLGLTSKQRALLLEVIRPDDPRNPFLPKLRRWNRAMILLHYRLGLRAGELAGLHRADYRNNEAPAQLFVHLRHNNPDDSRTKAFRGKTRARMLHVTGDAEEAMNVWLDHRADRVAFPHARKSRFLFTNVRGVELSLRAASDIFERLATIFPELSALCADVLRHDMNNRIVKQAQEKGVSFEEVQEDMQYLNGWAEKSAMSSRYAKSAIAARANARIESLQRKSVAVDGDSDEDPDAAR